MESYKLIIPCKEYAEKIKEYRLEFLDAESSMDGCGTLRNTEDPIEFIKNCECYRNPETTPEGKVPSTLLLFIRTNDDKLLGMIDIRHHLNHEYLSKYGGHIGYSIRPSERGQGYAKKMLALTLPIAKCRLGLDKVAVNCFENNIASEKTIISCGGVYESTVPYLDGERKIKRYWIDIPVY